MKKMKKPKKHVHKPYLVLNVVKDGIKMDLGVKDYDSIIFWCGVCSKEYEAKK